MNIPFFIIKEEHIRVRDSTSLYKSGKNEKKTIQTIFMWTPFFSQKYGLEFEHFHEHHLQQHALKFCIVLLDKPWWKIKLLIYKPTF